MANPLTGDFEAVLQVSGATVNRLLASMHQNAGANPDTPTFPHSMQMRVGDPDPIDGMRGWVAAQLGTPRIELIHGVSDRFWIEVPVRARYTPDAGSVPLPEFIHGTVRAQYRVEMVDPNCFGWEKITGEYLWVRVERDTVSFTGTAVDDVSIITATQASIDPATADARVTALARHLLATRFKATPHKVSKRFRQGAMRSLNPGIGNSLVAVPIGLSGDPSQGKIDSITQNILGGRDVAIGINRDVIMRKVQEQLDAFRQSFRTVFHFRGKAGLDLGSWGDVDIAGANIDWSITISAASAKWIGGLPPMMGTSLPGGLIEISLHGQARTQKSYLNFDFDVTQTMLIRFDGSIEEFTASPFGTAIVNVPGFLGAVIEMFARSQIQSSVATALTNAASGMTGDVSIANRKTELVNQLQTMDELSDVFFTDAVFTADGAIVRGNITVSPRSAPDISFGFNGVKNGYAAFNSWIPGGSIDSFNWSWKWFNYGGKPGFETLGDRYVLRRPAAKGQGQFGITLGVNQPLPGLDGMGQVCLVVTGTRVHAVTGEPEEITVSRKCRKFGFDLALATPDRLFLREWAPGPRDPIGPVAEVAVHEVNADRSNSHGANTLIIRAGNAWNNEVAASIRDGLANSRRRDAGLVVLVLFNEKRLMEAQPVMLEDLRTLAAEIEAPLVVNEDVESSWARALRMEDRDGVEWRLVTPTGGVTWMHSGYIAARDLSSVLDDYLLRSPPPAIMHTTSGGIAGERILPYAFESDVIGRLSRMEDACPPPPFERLGIETVVSFIRKNSVSSEAALRSVAESNRGRSEQMRVFVLDGGTREDAERMRELLPDAMIVADENGKIARRFGVSMWPSTLQISGSGVIMDAGEEREDTAHE
ncbi:MAG TPA: hypothetical protein VF042_12945 [Gemmatimonadaceae bacterium]